MTCVHRMPYRERRKFHTRAAEADAKGKQVEKLKEIQRIIGDKLGIPAESVRQEAKAADLEGWDSVNHIMIISDIEDTFSFKFGLEEIGEMDSVQKLLKAVEAKTS